LIEAILFYVLAAVLLGMGLLVISRTNPLASALCLVAAFTALAGLYATLSASFLAILQILVYAGGIMVLMIFVIMLLNLRAEDLKPLKARAALLALILLSVQVAAFGPVFLLLSGGGAGSRAALPAGFGNLASVGETLFSEFLFPFEMLSLVLLTAVVGALVLSKRKL
jgi:NADH-quinone oxidoreductase subunit J